MVEKKVGIGNKVFDVKISDGEIRARETIFPHKNYSNNFGTEYVININYSKKYAKAEIGCWNDGWATRGHGMTDAWTDSIAYLTKAEAKRVFAKAQQKLMEAEDGTPDVQEAFAIVRDTVCKACEERKAAEFINAWIKKF